MAISRRRAKSFSETDTSAATPRHEQLYLLLRAQIESGEFPVGGPFPTEEQLRAEHLVSRYALREALQRLESDGFIRRRRGSGSSVISRTPAHVFRHAASSQEDLLSYAFVTRVVWHESRLIRTDGRLARLLGCDELRQWQYLRGTRYEENGEPLGVVQVYVDAGLPPLPNPSEFEDSPVYRWVEQNCGVELVGLSQDIMAKPLTTAEAELLNDRPGASALQIVRRYFDSTNAIYVISVNSYRSHDFVYNIRSQLRRD
jgi:DNA-binding GntR family transcriptional regulator